jgi:RNA polymerase sigma factor (sigma-70 family)
MYARCPERQKSTRAHQTPARRRDADDEMSSSFEKTPVQSVLADAKWLRGFAQHLARDRAEADDMVQETCLAALRSAPDPGGSMRPWLAQVLRNFRRKGLRADTRRRTREVSATLLGEDQVASTETMLARLELQRMVSELVRDLEEPYRATILLRFFEGRTPTEMARAHGIPAGTVRWRLNEGLRRLRDRLDEAHGGSRESWKAILVAPVAAPVEGAGTGATAPASAPFSGLGKVAWLAGGALVPAMVAGLLLGGPHHEPAVSRADRPLAQTPSAAPETTGASNNTSPMNTLAGVVLPALVASAGAQAPTRQSTASPLILRSELPAAVEAALARATVGRELQELTIEPGLRKGYATYKVTFEDNNQDLDEQIHFAADGTLLEREVEIAIGDVPAVVVRTANGVLPDGTIIKAELRHEAELSFYALENGIPRGPLRHRAGKTFYRLDVRDAGATRRLHITEDGMKVLRNTLEE